ncbi:hypothetical protein HAX54_031165, partial [Datura stramonium]|nr:hypothetical protein [Datura stramonium]
ERRVFFQSEGEMEDCPNMYLVDYMEREKSEVFSGQQHSEAEDELPISLLLLV